MEAVEEQFSILSPELFFSENDDLDVVFGAPKLTELKNLLHSINLQHSDFKV
jgi:hypothetical protein